MKITGLTRYICDRCGNNDIIEPGNDTALPWYVHERDGSMFMLCSACEPSYASYSEAEASADSEYESTRSAAFAQWWDSWRQEQGADDGEEPEQSGEVQNDAV